MLSQSPALTVRVIQEMSRRIADLLVHFMPANLHKYSVPNAGADASAAKRLLETVAWDYDSHMELSQSCIL